MKTENYSHGQIDFYGHVINVIRDSRDLFFFNPTDCETILDIPETPIHEYIESNLDFLKEATGGSGGFVYCDGYVSSFVVVLYWLSELAKGSCSAQTIMLTFANEALFSRLKSANFS